MIIRIAYSVQRLAYRGLRFFTTFRMTNILNRFLGCARNDPALIRPPAPCYKPREWFSGVNSRQTVCSAHPTFSIPGNDKNSSRQSCDKSGQPSGKSGQPRGVAPTFGAGNPVLPEKLATPKLSQNRPSNAGFRSKPAVGGSPL